VDLIIERVVTARYNPEHHDSGPARLAWRGSGGRGALRPRPGHRIDPGPPGFDWRSPAPEDRPELAAPDQFIPEVPGWQDRSLYIAREGRIAFYHYDFYSQALAKIERGHSLDLEDVRKMLETGLVDRQELLYRFEQIEPRLHQHPAIDPVSFRHALEELVVGG